MSRAVELRLLRTGFSDSHTDGELTIDGAERYCYTVEDTVDRPPGAKVAGLTGIPFGRYPLTLTHSPAFKRELLLIGGVPGFSGIRIHRGNTPKDSAGCPLVGFDRVGPGHIGRSADAEVALTRKVGELLLTRRAWITVTGPTLRRGMGGRGEGTSWDEFMAVRVLQRWLGMPDHLRTGYFGDMTFAYVRSVQHAREGLVVDGVAGPLTWSRLLR